MTAGDGLFWPAVLLAGLGTYALRASFLFLFGYVDEVPTRAETVLGLVPAAVLAALAVPAIVAPEGRVAVVGNDRLLAGSVAALVAWRTGSILATIVTGLVVVILLGVI